MKNRALLSITLFFFLIVNTSYYWNGNLGLWAVPSFLFLGAVYLGLAITLVWQVFRVIREKFKDRQRLLTVGLLTMVLILTFLKPEGLIDFDQLEGEDLLIAEREGAANCITTLKLKDDFSFQEKAFCFGITTISGNYHVQNDTIYFDHVNSGRAKDGFYAFAVIRPTQSNNSKILANLIRYKDLTDTIGHELWITKNELMKWKGK